MAELSDQERKMLWQAPMFSGLDREQLDALAATATRISCRPQEPICRPDETADRFFAILAGRVKVFKLAPDGSQQMLHLFGPGQTFAEAAALKGMRFPAHAEAIDLAQLLAIGSEAFTDILRTNAQIVAGLVAGLTGKLKELADLAEDLSLKTVPARLAGVLLIQADVAGSKSFKLSVTKKQVAEQIGATPESLSRALKQFQQRDLITVSGSKIAILNRDLLETLASGLE